MRDLFIVGAGGFGREAAWTVERINNAAQQPLWRIIGFADDDPGKASGNFEGYPMLGSPEKASADNPGASVFVAIGDNKTRREIYRRLRGHDFPALIDPSAQVSPTLTAWIQTKPSGPGRYFPCESKSGRPVPNNPAG